MTEKTSDEVARYLRTLDDALRGVDRAVRRDIVNAAREELQGLESAEAEQRIAALGDPAFIAAEAEAASPRPASPRPAARPVPQPDREGTSYAVTASLLVALGGVIVPVLGWVAGLLMVWMSRQWWRWEKVVASLVVPAVGLMAVALALSSREPERGETVNPLGPTHFDTWWFFTLLVLLGNLIAGMWLLWRSRRAPRPLS